MYKLFKSKIVRWKSIWSKLWFPTSNFNIKLDIEDWTYKLNALIDDKIYKWLWVYFDEKWLFEAYFFDFDEDIYWEEIELCVHYKIRDNIKFKKYDDLISQVNKDIESTKKNKDYILTFWTFDIVHPGHEYYLKRSKLYWDKLVTVVSTDKNALKFKWRLPINAVEKRIENVKSLWLSDLVCHGEESSPLNRIWLYNPKVVCIGYDQIWFLDDLKKYIKENDLNIEIIRIPSYKEDKFKSSLIREYMDNKN